MLVGILLAAGSESILERLLLCETSFKPIMLERYTAFFLTAATAMAAQAQITLSDPNNVPLAGSAYPTIKAAYAPVPAGGIVFTFDYP